VVVIKTISQDYALTMVNASGANDCYQTYLQWIPTTSETTTPGAIMPMTDGLPNGSFTMGTMAPTEDNNFEGAYAQTKVKLIKVRYRPAQTMGVSNAISTAGLATFAGEDTTMTTCPIYDNVDNIVTAAGQLTSAATTAKIQNIRTKPYARVHSIYKPWQRILRPSYFQSMPQYNTSGIINKKLNTWIDVTNGNVVLNGLLIMVPAIKQAGEFVTATPPNLHPANLSSFVLGTVNVEYIQMFKTRT